MLLVPEARGRPRVRPGAAQGAVADPRFVPAAFGADDDAHVDDLENLVGVGLACVVAAAIGSGDLLDLAADLGRERLEGVVQADARTEG